MRPGVGDTTLGVFLRILDRLEEIIIASLMAGATLLIFVAVVHRYGTGISFLYPYLHQIHLAWAQELCIYMFIWMAKFGAAYGVRTGIHVGVDVLVNKLNPQWRKGVTLFGLLGVRCSRQSSVQWVQSSSSNCTARIKRLRISNCRAGSSTSVFR